MGDLTGKRIDQTFDGLIKTNDEGPINAISFKGLQDGVGNNLPVQVSTIGVNFTGTVTGDNNTTYQVDATGDGNNIVLEFLASDLTQQDITLIPGTDITFGLLNPNEITINATGGGGGGATYTVNVIQNGLNVDLQLLADAVVVDTITLQAGGNVQLNQQGQAVVFSSTDTNTTYDFGAVGAAGNINMALTGSNASNDVVTVQAGTNITLTDNGSNTFTIDASGGGGAAGLVNGTGPDSLKQADTLTASPATASGDQAVALGNGARATAPQTIALGDGAEATNIGGAAVGQYAEASGVYSSAWGRTSAARAEGSVAFGQQAVVQATEAGAVAMGRSVQAVYSETTHVRELMVVAPSGGTGGNGVILLSPNGTAYKITVDNAGTIISTLV